MSSVRDATGRIRDRRTRRRQRATRNLLIAGLVFLVVIGGTWLVGFSPVFSARQVKVSGTSLLTADQVRAQIGSLKGIPLARISERQVADRVAAMPQVRSVTVTRRWPSTLEIAVHERIPAYAIADNGRWHVVDEAGVAFLSTGARPADLIEATTQTNDPRALAGAASLAKTMSPVLRPELIRLEVASRDAITASLQGERSVVFGSGDQAELKMQVAEALFKSTRAKQIDVSAPQRPATR